ncbi:MAG: hypothetical protein ACK50F_09195, partial [Betaproteobacteria bacterium]
MSASNLFSRGLPQSRVRAGGALAVAAALACPGLAAAQSAGSWLVRVGVSTFHPRVTSGDRAAPRTPGHRSR